MSQPLADIRVLAIEQFGAGPWATLQLADLGADIIKIEDPDAAGDVGRYVPPYQEDEDSLFFETFNRNKRSVSLDLRTEAGRETFLLLAAEADAVFSNLRGDQPERLGLTYAALRDVNPRIVCCSLSGFGQTGPRAKEPGYDSLIQGLAGWMSVTGDPAGAPTRSGLSLVDFSAGYVAALALMAGLWRARRDGVGCNCDISLFESALAQLTYVGTWAATAGFHPRRMQDSAHPSIVPFQLFATADGFLTVACAKQKFWCLLCEAIERPEFLADPRFADFASRDTNRVELLAALSEVFASRTTADWLERLRATGVPSGPVNDVASALTDKQTVARGDVVEFDHPRFGRVRQLASPLRVGTERRPLHRAPQRGEHTAEVIAGVAGNDRFLDLELRGAFGSGGGLGSAAPDTISAPDTSAANLVAARSLLFTPGTDPRKLGRALGSGADAVIADLEDAVAPSAKAAARTAIAAAFAETADGVLRIVRINAPGTEDFRLDAEALREINCDAVLVPKLDAAGLHQAATLGRPVIALIETATGLRDSAQVAAHPAVAALMLGAEDLGLELALEPRADGLELLYARSKLVADSAAAGIRAPFDSVVPNFRDEPRLEEEARFARSIGLGGKACIHPAQVAVVNHAFIPDATEVERAHMIITAYEKAVSNGHGVATVAETLVDRPVAERAQAVLRRAGRGAADA